MLPTMQKDLHDTSNLGLYPVEIVECGSEIFEFRIIRQEISSGQENELKFRHRESLGQAPSLRSNSQRHVRTPPYSSLKQDEGAFSGAIGQEARNAVENS